MKPADREKFADLIVGIMSVYKQEVSRIQLEVWWTVLKGYDLDVVNQALSNHVADPDAGMYPPKPADVVKHLGGTTKDRAVLAWHKTMDGVRTCGPWKSVVFDDPIVHRVITDLGGWPDFCKVTDKELPFLQKRFEEAYRAYAFKGDVPEHPAKLIGVFEAQNNFNGWGDDPRAKKTAEPVLIGDLHGCRLIESGASAPSIQKLLERA